MKSITLSSKDLVGLLAEIRQRERAGKKAKPKRSTKAPVSLTEDELLKIFALAKKRRERDWILMLVTYVHGLRASEALNIRRGDLEGGYLRVRRGKDSEQTEQELKGHPHPLLNEPEAIATWLGEMAERGRKGSAKPGGRRSRAKILQSAQKVKFRTAAERDERLFHLTRQRFHQIFAQYAAEAGLPPSKRHPHVLKHTRVIHLLTWGVPIHEVTAWAGWKSIKTADHYTRVSAAQVDRSVDRSHRAAFHEAAQTLLFGN